MHVLSGQAQPSDKDLLQDFIEMLNTITCCRKEKSYNRRLYHLSVVVMDLAFAAESHHKRRRVASDLDRPITSPLADPGQVLQHRARSHTVSTLNSSNSHTASGIAEFEDRSFDCARLSESDDSFALVDTMAHMDAWAQEPVDELGLKIGSGLKGVFENFDHLDYSLESLGDVSGRLRV